MAETDNVEEPILLDESRRDTREGTPPILTMHTYLSLWRRAAPVRPAPTCGIAAGVPFDACVLWLGDCWGEREWERGDVFGSGKGKQGWRAWTCTMEG